MGYHIDSFGPTKPWPKGGFSLYDITGDQIAERVVRAKVNMKGWYEGEVIARHPWPGYVGLFETLAEVMKAIEEREEAKRNAPANRPVY